MDLTWQVWAPSQNTQRGLDVVSRVNEQNEVMPEICLERSEARAMRSGELLATLGKFIAQVRLTRRGALDSFDVHVDQRPPFFAKSTSELAEQLIGTRL